MPTLKEAVKGIENKKDPNIKIVHLKKKVPVVATEKHPGKTGSTRMVPEHMVEHLLKKGMIEDPNKPAKKAEKPEAKTT